MLHAGNVVTPARVTKGLPSRAMRALRQDGGASRREGLRERVAEVSAAESVGLSYSPSYSFSVNSAGGAEAALRELQARHARERAELYGLIMQRTSREFVEDRLRHTLEVEAERGAGS